MAFFQTVFLHKPALWTLDAVLTLSPLLPALVSSPSEVYVETAARTLEALVQHFGDLVYDNAQPLPRGVDLTREQRHEKCVLIAKEFSKSRLAIEKTRASAAVSEKLVRGLRKAEQALSRFAM